MVNELSRDLSIYFFSSKGAFLSRLYKRMKKNLEIRKFRKDLTGFLREDILPVPFLHL